MSDLLSTTTVYSRTRDNYKRVDSLRLLKPTKHFFKRLRSTIYQFIWQKKHPSLKKEIIFLPWTHGGLKVLDPVIQHHILQKRWLDYIFNPIQRPSFVYQIALNHFSLFPKSSHCPLVLFYFPEYCKSIVCDKHLSIWNAIFEAFDTLHANSTIAFPELPLTTLLDLPLYKLIITPTDNHWTIKHQTFLSSNFLFLMFPKNDFGSVSLVNIQDTLAYADNCISKFSKHVLSNFTPVFGRIFQKIYHPQLNGRDTP